MFFLILYSSNTFSQSQNWWKTDGNNGNNNLFIGTTNNVSLRLRANNTEWFSISPSGQYTFNGLSGVGNGLMLISNTGNVYRLNFSGNTNEVLTAAGTWQNINSLVPSSAYWTMTNAGLYTNNNTVINGTLTATGLNILQKIQADTIKGNIRVNVNGNLVLGEDGNYNGIYTRVEDLRINSKPGQNYNTILNTGTNGNVGIGNANPAYKLDVNGTARFNDKIYVSRFLPLPGDTVIHFGENSITIAPNWNNINYTPNVFTVGLFVFNIRGLSIGNAIAFGNKSLAFGTNLINYADNSIIMGRGTNTTSLQNTTPNSLSVTFNSDIPTLFVSGANGEGTTGSVGVGTTCIPVGYKLAVLGSAIFEEAVVKVANNGCWPDYVFDSNYKRMTWEEKENYLAKNKHLPDVSPAGEIENKGIIMSETLIGITKNVEENSLDIIEIFKRLEQLQKENFELKEMIKSTNR